MHWKYIKIKTTAVKYNNVKKYYKLATDIIIIA